MRILTRYILREVTSHAVIGAAIFTFVLFTRDLGRILELVVRASAPLPSVAEIFLYTVPRPNQIGALLVEERSYGTKMYAAPWYWYGPLSVCPQAPTSAVCPLTDTELPK